MLLLFYSIGFSFSKVPIDLFLCIFLTSLITMTNLSLLYFPCALLLISYFCVLCFCSFFFLHLNSGNSSNIKSLSPGSSVYAVSILKSSSTFMVSPLFTKMGMSVAKIYHSPVHTVATVEPLPLS